MADMESGEDNTNDQLIRNIRSNVADQGKESEFRLRKEEVAV
jgi:hypothetical protein